MTFTEQYDVAVVGAGHAGCEAAMAAARMGLKTALITMNMDLIAQMSCNPAIGGVAKGHLVREVDALGGVMGEVADAVGIQFRLLNSSRGPAVWSPRAQCDKQLYRVKMREVLEGQPGLHIRQAEVVGLIVEEGDSGQGTADRRQVLGLKLRDGRQLLAGATIITTGTFLNGLIHCGEEQLSGRAQRRAGLCSAGRSAAGSGLADLPAKDRDAAAAGWADDSLGGLRGAGGRRGAHALQLPDQENCAAADQLPYRLHHAGDAQHYSRECASLGDVLGADCGHWAALLPVHRRQDRQISRQDAAPVLSGAGGVAHPRGLRQRNVHVSADGGAVGDCALDSGTGAGGDAAPRLCH